MRELIEKIINKYDLPVFNADGDDTLINCSEDIVLAFLDFGKQVCELQKQECLKSAFIIENVMTEDEYDLHIKENPDFDVQKMFQVIVFDEAGSVLGFDIDEDSILNCKNVCE